ncbi:MAG TPA: hypothetical protein VFM77_19530 [Terriglobales bacterium]|nr:hypothetical protein [Terriglobales bacterium]
MRNLVFGLLLIAVTTSAYSQSTLCRDAGEEPHHRVVLESARVRVLLLELPRIASTDAFCYASPFVYIALGEGRSSITPDGKGTFSRDWRGAEAQIVHQPQQQVIRNESGNTFRELVVELRRGVEYDAMLDYSAPDMFPPDLGSVKPTWAVSFVAGGVKFSRVQLATGEAIRINRAQHLLVALNELTMEQAGAQTVSLNAQDFTNINAGTLTNSGRGTARFILIEY